MTRHVRACGFLARAFAIVKESLLHPLTTTIVEHDPPPTNDEAAIRTHLASHLGSEVAADAWLDSPLAGYPGTPREAIRAGQGDLVRADLEDRMGPGSAFG